MRRIPFVVGVAAAVASAILMACGDSPTQPSSNQRPSVSGLEIIGPASVPPGETAQFTARVRLTDGSTTLVTNETTWTSSNASVLSVSAGLVTGVERGEADLRAAYSGRSSTKHLMVLPEGTFKLSGKVHDGGFALTNARVEVTAGTGTGLSASATAGNYALYGVAGDIQLRATRDDYDPWVESLFVAGHQNLDIELVPSGARIDPTGTYTLNIEAAPECRSLLPAPAWFRSYTATIARNGSTSVRVTLGGANFLTSFSTANNFTGRLGADSVSFTLSGPFSYYFYYYYLASVMEQLAPATYFVPYGQLEAEPSAGGLSGAFDGTIEIREGTNVGRLTVTAGCRSANHRFTFTR